MKSMAGEGLLYSMGVGVERRDKKKEKTTYNLSVPQFLHC